MELKERLKKGTFYFYLFGLSIKSKIINVTEETKDYLNIEFENGHVNVFVKNIKTTSSPANIIADFEWCYILHNEYNDCIGYIGYIKEKGE